MSEHKKTQKSAIDDIVTRDYTINMHKRTHGRSFKSRAPTAIKAITKFACQTMGVKQCIIDPALNKAVWAKGIRSPPNRVRVRLARKRDDDKGVLVVHASFVAVPSFKGLDTVVVDME